MNKKKWLILLFIVLIVSPLLANSIYAATATPGPFEQVLKTLMDNFGFMLRSSFLKQDQDTVIAYVKVLLGIVLFLPLFFVLKKMFKNNGIAGGLSVAISLMSMIFIPPEMIGTITKTYAIVAVLFFYVIPGLAIFFFFWFMKKTVEEWNELAGAVVEVGSMVGGIFMTRNFQKALEKLAANPEYANTLGNFIQNLSYIYVILGIGLVYGGYKILKAFGGVSKAKEVGGSWLKRKGKGIGGDGGGGLPREGSETIGQVTSAERSLADIKQSIDRSTANAKGIIDAISATSASEENLIETTKNNIASLGNAVSLLGKALEDQAAYAKAGATAESIVAVNKAIGENGTLIKTKYAKIVPDFDNIKRINDEKYRELGVLLNEFLSSDTNTKIEELLAETQAVNVSVRKVSAKNKSVVTQLSNILSNPSVDENFKNQSVRNDLMALQNFGTRMETDLADMNVHNSACQKIKADLSKVETKINNIHETIKKFGPQIDGFKKELNDKLTEPFGRGLSPQVIVEAENVIQKIIKGLEDIQTKSTVVRGDMTIVSESIAEMKNLETDIELYLRELEDIKVHVSEMNQKYQDIAAWYAGQKITISL